MANNRTLTMIKPDAFADGNTGRILARIYDAGFRVAALKLTLLSREKAEQFYAVHNERPFYNELVAFMSSGPIVAAILEKEGAVEAFRTLIGKTNPAEAADGTIRREFGKSLTDNAVHGSDSDENAEFEGNFFFTAEERF